MQPNGLLFKLALFREVSLAMRGSEDEEVDERKQNADCHEGQSDRELRPTGDGQRAHDAGDEQERDHDEHDDEVRHAGVGSIGLAVASELVHGLTAGFLNEQEAADEAENERNDEDENDRRPVGSAFSGLEHSHASNAAEDDRGGGAAEAGERLAPRNASVADCGRVGLRHQRLNSGDGVVQSEAEEEHEGDRQTEVVRDNEHGAR